MERKNDNMPFFGIPMTFKQRRIHAALMLCICIVATVLDLYKNYGPEYQINYWYYYPPMIASFFLLYETLPWNIDRKTFDIKTSCYNVLTWMVMSLTVWVLSAFIFAIIFVANK